MKRATKYLSVAGCLLCVSLWCSPRLLAQTSVTDLTFPPAFIGMGYSVRLSLDGIELATPVTTVITGLPGGLTFDSAAETISGVPLAADPVQTYSISITIKDANSKTVTATGKMILNAASTVVLADGTPTELPDAIEGQTYRVQLRLPAGAAITPPLQNLPRGLTTDAAGLIQGTPNGDFSDGEYHGNLQLAINGGSRSAGLIMQLHLTPPALKLSAPCAGTSVLPPTVTSTVTDVTSMISGMAAPAKGCNAKIVVWSIDPVSSGKLKLDYLGRHPTSAELQDAHGNLVQIKSGEEVTSNGKFSVELSATPRAGQTLVVEETFLDSSQTVVASIFSTPIPVHFAGDWGRIKTYFTSGILLSQDQGSFSQSSLFLSFLLDKTWVLARPVYAQSHWVPGVNTFFETRLTSVPVTAQPCPTNNTTPGGQCTNQNGSDIFNTFLTSQKTARLAIGTYLPFVTKVWTYNGVRNGLFVAPLAKIGLDTPAAPINQSQAQSQSSNAGNTLGTVVVPVNNASFYNFYAYGARVGHVALPAPEKARDSDAWSVNEAPELNSYLDIAVGRFSNLPTFLKTGNYTRLYRVSLEGLLKVPSTPLVIGVSANLGQANVGVNSAAIQKKAADDLRFLLGTKFDVGKITSYLAKHAF